MMSIIYQAGKKEGPRAFQWEKTVNVNLEA